MRSRKVVNNKARSERNLKEEVKEYLETAYEQEEVFVPIEDLIPDRFCDRSGTVHPDDWERVRVAATKAYKELQRSDNVLMVPVVEAYVLYPDEVRDVTVATVDKFVAGRGSPEKWAALHIVYYEDDPFMLIIREHCRASTEGCVMSMRNFEEAATASGLLSDEQSHMRWLKRIPKMPKLVR